MRTAGKHKGIRAFTLIELLIYISMFAAVSFLLTGILTTVLKIQSRGVVANEVSSQLNFVLETINRHVRESSLIEKVYEGGSESSACVAFCSVKLRMSSTSKDPTLITSDSAGVYIKEGSGPTAALTNNKVVVNSVVFSKREVPRGHTILNLDLSFKYNSTDSGSLISRSIKSAIGRVSAANFDDHLLPVAGADSVSDVGQSPSRRWRNGWFGGDFVIEGVLSVGATSNPAGTSLYVPDGKYAQFAQNFAGAPPATDCDEDAEVGRLAIDTSNNRLYVCNLTTGTNRKWDYLNLTN